MIVHKTVQGVSQRALQQFLQRACGTVALGGEVNVLVTSSSRMRALNRRFRGKDKATDVLSFPAPAELASQAGGDIAISADIALRNASILGHTPMHELKVLVLHGVLHLAGYDHEQDAGAMARKEERLRLQFGLQDGLIARAGRVARAAARSAKPAAGRTVRRKRSHGTPQSARQPQ